MPSKLDFYAQMADHTAKQVTGSFGEWTAFLETMGRLYKYPFHEQLMIFAQKPNATACADYDLWNKQMGRYVRRGTKGIALIDTSGDNPRLKYVFDVSDTGGRENSRRLNLWEYKDEHQDAVTAALENRYGVSGEKGLADQLEQVASKLVTEYWNDNSRDILGILADSFLEEYDDYNVEVAFRNAATVSTTYALMSRCGLNPSDYFEHEDFLSVFDFNTRDTIAVLGSAVSNSSEQILRQIAVTVKNYEREASLQNQAERTQNYGEHIELHEERGLLYPESDSIRHRDEAPGQVRQDEEEVFAGAQTSAVEPDDSVGDPVPPSEGNRRDGEPQNGTDDARTDESERRDGGTESQRPDDVDRLDEQPQSTSRRSNSRRTDSRISGQLTLFDVGLFPSEQEQISFIDEAESVKPAPFAFSFAQEDIDDVLRLASNSEHTRMNVAAAFQKQKPTDEIVSLLQKEYHGGAGLKSERGEFSVWYAEDGIHLAKGRTARYSKTAQVISWEDAAERIGQLMDEGKYATNVELAEAELHERTELSHKLWYIRGDLSDEAREQNVLGTLQDYRRGGFPDATARLAEDLKDPAFREMLSADYSAFMDAYKADRDVMRFHYHKPVEIWNALQDLDLPRREYTSDMAEVPKVGMFITEDEIDATLNRGSNVEGGKGRIYGYLTSSHNSKEKADFLKNEYGIGGSSHSVSGRGWIDSSGKGIRLQKPDCADVELNWNKVLTRFENLIRNGRYFTPEQKAKYEEMQTREGQFRKLMDAYNDIKHEHPDDIVLFQVGDFFEMYGEDAKTAAKLLDLNLTTHPVAGAGRVEMCGIPAHNLEQSVEKLRATHGVTVSEFNGIVNEHISRSLPVLPAVEELSQEPEIEPVSVTEAPNESPPATVEAPVVSREITQAEIDEALQRWNGNIESKRAVVRYMADHARERDTAAWLSKEYGGDVSKPLHITVTGTDLDYEMSWAKVQRRVAQLIKEDRFYTQEEYDRLDDIDPVYIRAELAQRGIVNGELVEPEKLDNDPFIQQVNADAEKIAQHEADEAFAKEHLVPRESTYEIDGRRFVVDSVNLDFGSVSLQDVTFRSAMGFPIFRSESIEFMRRLVEISEAQRTAELPTEPKFESETVAFYSAEDNHLPYDVEIRTIKAVEPEPPAPKPELHNFQITDDHLGEGGAKAKFRMNMDAINLLKELEFDGRQATPEEQEVLAKYVGWGGLADAFDETKDNWKNEFAELYATLSPEEYAAARSSTLNAHYTSPTVIKAIYEAVGNMGFETGNILEPSMGVGNFFGCLPEAMQNSKLYGVELDSITGRIAKQLYPKADITIAGFETTDRRDFYDLAIGNVPFGQYQVNDRAYNKLGFSIHDYFFAKALDQVRPGGVVAFVTSRYTMDKQSPEVRKYIAQRADLLGAIRLPNNAFKANAGTEVVSDIIFLQKRDRPIEIEPDWVHLGKNDDGFAINSYFIDNPEMVLGRQTSESTQYGKQDFTVEPYENLDLGVQLGYAIQNIKGTYTEAELPDLGDGEAIDTSIPADPNVKNYSYTVVDGDVYYRENSRMVKPELNATATERVKGMVELRDCVQKLIGQQMDGFVSDASIRNKGLAHFDCWASTFGETTTAIELAPEGTGYRARTRFAKFFNLPELMNLFKEAADIKTADQLNLPTPTPIYHNEVAQPTEIQKAMVQELSERAAAVHSGKVDPSVDNMLRITSDGRKLGLDQRIINPNLPDEPTSKVNMCVDNIHRIWEDGHADKLTQLVFCDLSTPKSTPSKRAAKAPAGNLDSPEIRALEHLAEKDGGTEEEQRFTVYDDIRDKLVEGGIPREQIAFIHEANTEARKKELFSKVRSGQVRVLMGSTFKMGAGMNVQDRLIALHDLDAPWRPGDLEQRSGRIIRQGNMNPEVHIYRYVTEATFDAYLWQTLENKQKFISQIMTSKSPVRACDDIDETALSYAEIKALCAGDERIKEKMDLDVDVARLKLMKANHQSQQYRLEDNLLRYFPEQIEQNKKFIEGFNADMKTLAEHPHPVDGFAGMTVRGDVLTDKENAGAALVDAFKDVKGLDPVQIGTYRGFTMSLTLEDFGRDYVLTLKGQMTHRVTLGKDPRGNLTRIDNTLNGMAERLTTVQGKLDSLYAQMETAKQELGKPFPQETELKAKSARLAELNIALNIDDKTPLEAMAEEAPPRAEIAKSAKPSVLQKLHSYDKPSKPDPLEPKKSKEEVR